jgi:mono/diheme cytochrome c family protein
MKWFTLLALALVAPLARAQSAKGTMPPAADTSPSASPDSTTLAGVYTTIQAARGKNVYAGSCRSCHTPQSHIGETFQTWWRGKLLSDLFTFVSTRMPKNDPGSLAPEDAADVVAYLLQMNAMPPGKHELPPSADSLKPYRIEMKVSAAPAPDNTATRKKP